MRRKDIFRYILFILFLVPLLIFIFQTDFTTIKYELAQIGPKFLYIILTTFIAYTLATWGWYFCFGADRKKISFYQLFIIRQVGESFALYNPTGVVGGDFIKAELLKSTFISRDTALNSVLVSRITAILSQILLFLVTLIWILYTAFPQAQAALGLYALYAMIGFIILAKVFFFRWLARPVIDKNRSAPSPSFVGRMAARANLRIRDIKYFFHQNKKMFWISYVLFAAHWVVGSIEFYLILRFLHLDVLFMHGLLLDMSVVVIKSLLAFIPGQIGVEELANKFLLHSIGISTAGIWVTASIVRRTRQLFWIGIGFILYLWLKYKTFPHAAS